MDLDVFTMLGRNSSTATKVTSAINMVAGLVGVLLNTLVTAYYLTKAHRGKIVPFLYTLMCMWNTAVSLLAILQAIILILDLDQSRIFPDIQKQNLIIAGYIMYSMATRASVLQCLILSIVRSINISRPFQHINWRSILPVLVIMYAVWLSIASLDIVDFVQNDQAHPIQSEKIIEGLMVFPQPGEGMCLYFHAISNGTLCNVATNQPLTKASFSLMMVFMIAPAVLMFLTSLHQCYVITKKAHRRSKFTQSHNSQSFDLTVTILIVSFISLITNATYEVFYFIVYVTPLSWFTITPNLVMRYYLSTVVHFLDALLQPAVFISRGKNLRQYFLKSFKKFKSAKIATKDLHLKDL